MLRTKKSRLLLGVIGLVLIVGWQLGPRIIKNFYLSHTNQASIDLAEDAYRETVQTLRDCQYGSAKWDSLRQRQHQIHLWFTLRGMQIDEGHDVPSVLEEWQQILEALDKSAE